MTRGRHANDLHLVAGSLEQAREQWVAAAGRGRPDLGLDPARVAAERAAGRYAPTPAAVPAAELEVQLAGVLDGLRAGWTVQADAVEQLARLGPRLDAAEEAAGRVGPADLLLSAQQTNMLAVRADAQTAAEAAGVARAELDRAAAAELTAMRQRWDAQLPAVDQAARAVAAGSGRLGLGRGKVRDAQQHLDDWAAQWRPVLGRLPASLAQPRVLAGGWHPDRVQTAMRDQAAELAAWRSPEQVEVIRAAEAAHRHAQSVAEVYRQAADRARHDPGRRLAAQLPQLTDQDNSARGQLQTAGRRLEELTADPAAAAQPDRAGWLTAARGRWEADRGALPAQRWRETAARVDPRLLDDPAWPHLAAALDRAEAAGYDVRGGLADLIKVPLPDKTPARYLEFRLADACPASTPPPPPPRPPPPPPADRPPAPEPARPGGHEPARPVPYTRPRDRGPSRGFGR